MSNLKVNSIKTDSLTDVAGTGYPYTDNLPAFSVYRTYTTTGSLVITASASSLMVGYDVTTHNWNGIMNLATGLMTAPVKGLYALNSHFSGSHTSLQHFDYSIWKNGVGQEPTYVADRPSSWAAGGAWISGSINTILALNAGDTVGAGMTAVNVTGQTLTNVIMRYSLNGFLIKRL